MKVYTPSKNYTGVSAGVAFYNGAGETDGPRLLNWFRDHGYEAEAPEPETQKPGTAEGPEERTAKEVGE